ncbi:MAG: zinc-binding dehydrogenase [Caldilineaceae bacterium]
MIAVDISPTRLDYATGRGPRDRRRCHGCCGPNSCANRRRGADVCIEAAGRPETLKQCFAAVHANGTVVRNGEQPSVELSPSQDFIRRDITAFGSWFYPYGEFPAMLALYRQGLPVEKLITHTFPLADGDQAFHEFAAGRTGKVLLQWDDRN